MAKSIKEVFDQIQDGLVNTLYYHVLGDGKPLDEESIPAIVGIWFDQAQKDVESMLLGLKKELNKVRGASKRRSDRDCYLEIGYREAITDAIELVKSLLGGQKEREQK